MSLRFLLAPALLAAHRAAAALVRPPPGAVRLLILHDVPERHFAALAALLADLGRRCGFVTPAEAAARLGGAAPDDGRAPVLLTFDDGFRSNGRVAAALLGPAGIKALLFVCPGLIDLGGPARRAAIAAGIFRGRVGPEAVDAELDLLEWDDLGRLAAAGHEIGCHSFGHACLAGLPAAELERQVTGARRRLEAALGRVPDWFATPFGDRASIDAQALAAIGRQFRFCRSGIRGLAHAGTPPLALPAESVDLAAGAGWRLLAAEGGLAPLYRRQRNDLAALAAAVRR